MKRILLAATLLCLSCENSKPRTFDECRLQAIKHSNRDAMLVALAICGQIFPQPIDAGLKTQGSDAQKLPNGVYFYPSMNVQKLSCQTLKITNGLLQPNSFKNRVAWCASGSRFEIDGKGKLTFTCIDEASHNGEESTSVESAKIIANGIISLRPDTNATYQETFFSTLADCQRSLDSNGWRETWVKIKAEHEQKQRLETEKKIQAVKDAEAKVRAQERERLQADAEATRRNRPSFIMGPYSKASQRCLSAGGELSNPYHSKNVRKQILAGRRMLDLKGYDVPAPVAFLGSQYISVINSRTYKIETVWVEGVPNPDPAEFRAIIDSPLYAWNCSKTP